MKNNDETEDAGEKQGAPLVEFRFVLCRMWNQARFDADTLARLGFDSEEKVTRRFETALGELLTKFDRAMDEAARGVNDKAVPRQSAPAHGSASIFREDEK